MATDPPKNERNPYRPPTSKLDDILQALERLLEKENPKENPNSQLGATPSNDIPVEVWINGRKQIIFMPDTPQNRKRYYYE